MPPNKSHSALCCSKKPGLHWEFIYGQVNQNKFIVFLMNVYNLVKRELCHENLILNLLHRCLRQYYFCYCLKIAIQPSHLVSLFFNLILLLIKSFAYLSSIYCIAFTVIFITALVFLAID